LEQPGLYWKPLMLEL